MCTHYALTPSPDYIITPNSYQYVVDVSDAADLLLNVKFTEANKHAVTWYLRPLTKAGYPMRSVKALPITLQFVPLPNHPTCGKVAIVWQFEKAMATVWDAFKDCVFNNPTYYSFGF